MDDWISKKDLLAQTGISYGQLYRWKRDKLIPENWFNKRPSYTGQETFFPRAQILERVYFILTHKDEYPLTQLRGMLAPGAASRAYETHAIARLEDTENAAAAFERMTGLTCANHGQALAIAIAGQYDAACHPGEEALEEFIRCILSWQEQRAILDKNEGAIYAVEGFEKPLFLFLTAGPGLLMSEGAKVTYTVNMNDLSRLFTRKLNTIYEVK